MELYLMITKMLVLSEALLAVLQLSSHLCIREQSEQEQSAAGNHMLMKGEISRQENATSSNRTRKVQHINSSHNYVQCVEILTAKALDLDHQFIDHAK